MYYLYIEKEGEKCTSDSNKYNINIFFIRMICTKIYEDK